MSILIDSVTPHTPAAKAGIQAGDRLVAVNGNLIHDVLDYRFYMIDTALTVEVERDSKPLTFHIKKRSTTSWGWNLPITSWIASTTAPISAFSASSISCPAACAKPSTLRMTTAA